MMNIRQGLLTYLRKGMSVSDSHEISQKIIIIKLFSFVGMSITGILAVTAHLNDNVLLATALYFASMIFIFAHHILITFRHIDTSASIILYSLYLLMFYLVHSGGADNTGPLWIFMVAPVSLFLKGLKKGLVSIGLFLLVIATLLFYPNNELLDTLYTPSFKLRLIYSFLTITFLSGCYEYSRLQSFQHVKDLSREYEQLSKYDPLTGVSNRRDATNKLRHEQRRIAQNQKKLSIILCDVDYFKRVNDEFGHEIGDRVLVQLADLFSSVIRQRDLVARWGGEEFLIMLPDTDVRGANLVAKKIHQGLADLSMDFSGAKPRVTVSIGIAEVNAGDDIKKAIGQADKHLYEAKSCGRNRTCSGSISKTI